MFHGSICALVTPFRGGRVDEAAFQRLVEWQIAEGSDGLVVCGTTGESPTLSHQEHRHVVELCVRTVRQRIPVIAGTGSNSTFEAIELTQHAQAAGADGVLVVAPYYNRPTQQGVYQHYRAIHDASEIPIIVYNIPSRCGIDISLETTERLAGLERIVGIKDATQDLSRPLYTTELLGTDFCQLSGEDASVVAFLAQGGVGCISVTANLAPRLCAELHRAWRGDNLASVIHLRDTLTPLHRVLFIESSPAPAKFALSLLGRCSPQVRLPLVEPTKESCRLIEQVVRQLDL